MPPSTLAALAGMDRTVVLPVVAAVIAVLSFVFGGGAAWKLIARIRRNLTIEELRPAWLQDIEGAKREMIAREEDFRNEVAGKDRLWEQRFAHFEQRVLPAIEDMGRSCRSMGETLAAHTTTLDDVSRFIRAKRGEGGS